MVDGIHLLGLIPDIQMLADVGIHLFAHVLEILIHQGVLIHLLDINPDFPSLGMLMRIQPSAKNRCMD